MDRVIWCLANDMNPMDLGVAGMNLLVLKRVGLSSATEIANSLVNNNLGLVVNDFDISTLMYAAMFRTFLSERWNATWPRCLRWADTANQQLPVGHGVAARVMDELWFPIDPNNRGFQFRENQWGKQFGGSSTH